MVSAIEELPAFHAEAFLEHVLRIGRRPEEAGTVDLRRHLVGDELADLVELLPVLRRREVIAVLGLELLLHLRIVENVLAVVEQHDVAVVREAVDLAVIGHLVVAIGRRDVLELFAIAELVDVADRAARSAPARARSGIQDGMTFSAS